jgi:hypothetical protein
LARRILNFPQCYNGTLFEHADGTPRRSWLWVEWEIPGGIRKIIEDWQNGLLREYPPTSHWGPIAVSVDPEVETHVLDRLHKEARALKRYERGQYRDLLTSFEQTLLSLERECLYNLPHYRGRAVYEWIAEHPKVRASNYGWHMVKDALQNINDVMVAYYDVELKEKMRSTLLELRRVYQEIHVEQNAEPFEGTIAA